MLNRTEQKKDQETNTKNIYIYTKPNFRTCCKLFKQHNVIRVWNVNVGDSAESSTFSKLAGHTAQTSPIVLSINLTHCGHHLSNVLMSVQSIYSYTAVNRSDSKTTCSSGQSLWPQPIKTQLPSLSSLLRLYKKTVKLSSNRGNIYVQKGGNDKFFVVLLFITNYAFCVCLMRKHVLHVLNFGNQWFVYL